MTWKEERYSGAFYEGEFVEGKRTGFGTCHQANGELYVGEFRDGNRHGEGKYFFKAKPGDVAKSFYDGSYDCGVRQGCGT